MWAYFDWHSGIEVKSLLLDTLKCYASYRVSSWRIPVRKTVFSSIFSCVNTAGDLKMAARYFTLEEVLERVVNDEEVSDFDDESEEDLPDVSESENNGDSSESESEFIENSDGSGRFVLFVYIWRKIFVIYE